MAKGKSLPEVLYNSHGTPLYRVHGYEIAEAKAICKKHKLYYKTYSFADQGICQKRLYVEVEDLRTYVEKASKKDKPIDWKKMESVSERVSSERAKLDKKLNKLNDEVWEVFNPVVLDVCSWEDIALRDEILRKIQNIIPDIMYRFFFFKHLSDRGIELYKDTSLYE